jgi:hypothetical protein
MFAFMYWDQWDGKPGVLLHSNRGIPTEGRSVVLKVQRGKREKTRPVVRCGRWASGGPQQDRKLSPVPGHELAGPGSRSAFVGRGSW